MKLTILGHAYELIETDPGMWTGRGLGRSNITTGVISLLSTAPKDTKASTLLHEVIHQLIDLLDLEQKSAGDETVISTLSVGLLDFLRSNPEVVKAYLESN